MTFSALQETYPALLWSAIVYVLFSAVALVFQVLGLLWPHLFLLALQDPLGGYGDTQVWFGLLFGLLPVGLVGWFIDRRWPSAVTVEARELSGCVVGGAVNFGVFLLLDVIAHALAYALGWKMGV